MTASASQLAEHPTLFDLHPEGAEPPVAQRIITPGCLLPIPNKLVIDIDRVCSILNVRTTAARYLLRVGVLSGYKLSSCMRWQVEYASVVEFCDALRVTFAIADRRPAIPAGRRHRDADLLPFPPSDTVSVSDAMVGLEVTKSLALKLIEEGKFEAYRLTDHSPWRISKSSLYAYRDRLRAQLESSSGRNAFNKSQRGGR